MLCWLGGFGQFVFSVSFGVDSQASSHFWNKRWKWYSAISTMAGAFSQWELTSLNCKWEPAMEAVICPYCFSQSEQVIQCVKSVKYAPVGSPVVGFLLVLELLNQRLSAGLRASIDFRLLTEWVFELKERERVSFLSQSLIAGITVRLMILCLNIYITSDPTSRSWALYMTNMQENKLHAMKSRFKQMCLKT